MTSKVSTKICPVCAAEFSDSLTNCPADGVLLTAPDPLLGTMFDGKYEILRVIGQGGMSIVYQARDSGLERLVALKLLKGHLISDPTNLKRFQREAKMASVLRHPNIISVFGFGVSSEGTPYLVLEYVEGRSLGKLLEADKPLSSGRAARLFGNIADALEHAHKQGIIHRDLKPSNVIVSTVEGHEVAKVLDFGTARWLDPAAVQQQLTQAGEVLGTLMYMAPEQKTGGKLDARVDVYALGYMLHEATEQKCVSHPKFAPLIQKALEDDPEKRFASAREFKAALLQRVPEASSELSATQSVTASGLRGRLGKKTIVAAALLLLVAGLALGSWFTASETVRLEQLLWMEKQLPGHDRETAKIALKLVKTKLAEGEVQGAARFFDQEVRTRFHQIPIVEWPLRLDYLSTEAEIHCRTYNIPRAMSVLNRVLSREKSLVTQDPAAFSSFRKVRLSLREEITRLALIHRRGPTWLLHLGDHYLEEPTDPEKARQLWEESAKVSDQVLKGVDRQFASLRVRNRICTYLINKHQYKEALEIVEKALADPLLNERGSEQFHHLKAEYFARYADCMKEQQRWDKAEEALRKAIAAEPDRDYYSLHLTNMLLEQDKPAQALEVLNQAEPLSVTASARFSLETFKAKVALAEHRFSDAVALAELARKHAGEAALTMPFFNDNVSCEGEALYYMNEPDKALALVRQICEKRQKFGCGKDLMQTTLLSYQGDLLFRSNRIEEGIAKVEEARACTNNADTYRGLLFSLTDANVVLKHPQKAAEYLNQVWTPAVAASEVETPIQCSVWARQACIDFQLGHKDASLKQWHQLLDLFEKKYALACPVHYLVPLVYARNNLQEQVKEDNSQQLKALCHRAQELTHRYCQKLHRPEA